MRLYLLVETKFESNSELATLLFNAITLSPVRTVSFFHGHFHFLDLKRDIVLEPWFSENFGGPGKF